MQNYQNELKPPKVLTATIPIHESMLPCLQGVDYAVISKNESMTDVVDVMIIVDECNLIQLFHAGVRFGLNYGREL
jgi:uncharacterized membrane protein (DUF441 family)